MRQSAQTLQPQPQPQQQQQPAHGAAPPPPLPPVMQNPFPPSPPPGSAPPKVPRLIWMFWDDDRPPQFIAACIEQLVRMNPGWTLHLLRPNEPLSMQGWVEPLPVDYLDMPHVADWYRISVLSRHGGVWLDASTVALKPIESWIDVNSVAQVQGFAMPGNTDDVTMENWAFACPTPSPFCVRWMENFKRALVMGTDSYCNGLSDSVLGALGRSMLPYLTQHAAWRETRQQLPDALVRVVPSDSPQGPFFFLEHVYGSDPAALMSTGPEGIFNIDEMTWRTKYSQVSFVKFRGVERQYINDLNTYHGYLASVLLEALEDGYVGGDYIEMNPFSIWWWVNVSIASLIGGLLLGALIATLTTYCVMRRGPTSGGTLEEQIERRAALTKLKEAGLSCGAARSAGYSCADAKAVDYTLIDAKAAGWTLEELLNAGYINQALAMRLRATDEPGRTLRLNVGSEGGALVNSLEESPTKHR